MKKDFVKELAELINKHGLEKEMRNTPDYILAQVCVDAMAVFSEAIARRDEWHGFRKADKKNAKRKYPDDCNIYKDRFKCADFMNKQPFSNLIIRMRKTNDEEERKAIYDYVKTAYKATLPKKLEDIPQEVKDIAGILGKALDARVEIRRIEVPEKKRRFRKKPRKEDGNETR